MEIVAKSGVQKLYLSGLDALKVVVLALKKLGLRSDLIMLEICHAGRTLCPPVPLRKELGFKKDHQNSGRMKSRFSILFKARAFRDQYHSDINVFDLSSYDPNLLSN